VTVFAGVSDVRRRNGWRVGGVCRHNFSF
jgi:hypothetical protein